jgi:hypothetical protein
LSLKKLINKKHFLVKEKFGLISKKLFPVYFGWKTLSRTCEKIRNIILFTDYDKFHPQTFDCYIFCFESFFFSISSLRIWFNLIFILTLVLIFMIVICFSLIIFLIYQIWSLFFWLLLILFEIIYEIVIIIILISSSFNFFYILDLISIILILFILFEIIYEIRFFFNFIFIQLFNL